MGDGISHKRSLLLAASGLVGLIALACGSGTPDATVVPTIEAQPTASTNASVATPSPARITGQEAATPTLTPSPQSSDAASTPIAADSVPNPKPYDPTATMYRVFSGFGGDASEKSAALTDIRRAKDTSQVPVLIEAMRYTFDIDQFIDIREEMTSVLQLLTGQNFGSREWNKWMEWLGKNLDEFRPPEGYLAWKINLLSEFDPGYAELLGSADETSRINLTEIVWGGVIIDGIPDLRDPNIIPADEADYIESDERVFGVSINGEHRAYPLRITNPHEMVNDVLGGEPISLAW
ncbi:MAG: DUF3179 domain-containing protein [Chloroflexi bacterium]|nr:DUF3179 domain-containing protein [Chloroflexota bacterium]